MIYGKMIFINITAHLMFFNKTIKIGEVNTSQDMKIMKNGEMNTKMSIKTLINGLIAVEITVEGIKIKKKLPKIKATFFIVKF